MLIQMLSTSVIALVLAIGVAPEKALPALVAKAGKNNAKAKEEKKIKVEFEENYVNVKSVSFLLHNEHGFDQAPLEEITEEEYVRLSALVTPISSFDDTINMDDMDISECEGGACPVR